MKLDCIVITIQCGYVANYYCKFPAPLRSDNRVKHMLRYTKWCSLLQTIVCPVECQQKHKFCPHFAAMISVDTRLCLTCLVSICYGMSWSTPCKGEITNF